MKNIPEVKLISAIVMRREYSKGPDYCSFNTCNRTTSYYLKEKLLADIVDDRGEITLYPHQKPQQFRTYRSRIEALLKQFSPNIQATTSTTRHMLILYNYSTDQRVLLDKPVRMSFNGTFT